MNAKQMTSEGGDGPISEDSAADCGWRLSCLLDGELDAEHCREIFEQHRRDADINRRWSLLNCVGDALRSPEVAAWHSGDFVARVSAALEKEPTALAPAARPPRSSLRRWILPGAGAAAAAAVVVAVGLPSRQPGAPETVAENAKALQPVAVMTPGMQVDRSPLLESYLAAHRELAEPTLMPHSTPYVRTSATPQAQEGR